MYPILNLSHAVGVVCYELANLPLPEIRLAPPQDMEIPVPAYRPVP